MEMMFVVPGLALIGAGLFLLIRLKELFNKTDQETGGYQDIPFDLPNHIKMAGFGIALIGFGCLSIGKALVGWFFV